MYFILNKKISKNTQDFKANNVNFCSARILLSANKYQNKINNAHKISSIYLYTFRLTLKFELILVT